MGFHNQAAEWGNGSSDRFREMVVCYDIINDISNKHGFFSSSKLTYLWLNLHEGFGKRNMMLFYN